MEGRYIFMAKGNPNHFQHTSIWSYYCIFPNWIHSPPILFLSNEHVLFTIHILYSHSVDKFRIKKREYDSSILVIYDASCIHCFIHFRVIHCPRYDDPLLYHFISIHSISYHPNQVIILRFF